MPVWSIILMSASAGIAPGAVLLSLLTLLFFYVFIPDALKDGQFGLIFFLVVPLGGLIGAGAGAVLAYLRLGKPSIAGGVWCGIGGVIVVLLLLLTFGWPGSQTIPWIWIIERIVRRLPQPNV